MIVRLALLGAVALVALALARRRTGADDPKGEFSRDRTNVEAGGAGDVEGRLREELLACETGFRSVERWALIRTRLAQLLIGAGELDAAAEVLGREHPTLDDQLVALGRIPTHEVEVLRGHHGDEALTGIRADRELCLQHMPERHRRSAAHAWDALEGLCRACAGHDDAAISLLESGLYTLENNLARVVYLLHLGEAQTRSGRSREASSTLEAAARAFPGSTWARRATRARDRLKGTIA